jgi:hypothetical protein
MKAGFFRRRIFAGAILAAFSFNLFADDGGTNSPREKLPLDSTVNFTSATAGRT